MGTMPNIEQLVDYYKKCFRPDQLDESTVQGLRHHAKKFLDDLEKVEYEHILTTPLLDVLSVNIHSDNAIFNDGKPFEVHGTIQVMTGEGIIHDLYNHSPVEPETISNGGTISLIVPKGCAIFPSGEVRMEIDLKDNARNVQIAKGSLVLEFENQIDYEMVKTEKVRGEYGFASVRYVTFRHAVIANLDAIPAKKSDGGNFGGFDIYGSIIAHYGTTFSSKLFEKNPSQLVTVEDGASIELSRHVLAVPAHSPLVIEAKLWTGDGQQIVCKDRKLEFYYFGLSYTEDLAENGSVKVKVMWEHAYMLPPPQSTLKDRSEEAPSEKKEDNLTDQLDIMPYVGSDQQWPLPFFRVIRNSSSEGRRASSIEPWPYPLLEVFSIFVGTFKDAASTVYGTIRASRYGEKFPMFERNQNAPVNLLPNQTIPIVYPLKSFLGKCFSMNVELEDVDGSLMSRGFLGWTDRHTEFTGWSDSKNKCRLSWYDRHLSSVIRGLKGYAAVHYMIITSGLQATLNVSFLAKSSCTVGASVWGSLVGRYSNQRYPTHYEREYFRSKLLWKHQEEAIAVSSGDKIPLSQPVVSVPFSSSFIVDVDLQVRIDGDGDDSDKSPLVEALGGFCLEFRTDTDYSESPLIITGEYCDFQISLQWSNPPC